MSNTPNTPSTRRLVAGLALSLVTAIGTAQPTILLDDFDADDSDELFGPLGLLAVFTGPIPSLNVDEDFASPGDVGAIRYTDVDPDPDDFVVGQYPNSVLDSLELDFEALGIIGFRMTFANSATQNGEDWSFGIRLLDDGVSSLDRRSAGGDVLVPAGPGQVVVDTYFDSPEWVFDDGFELDDIRQVAFSLNSPNDVTSGFSSVPTLSTEFLRFEAILIPAPGPAAALLGLAGLAARRRRF